MPTFATRAPITATLSTAGARVRVAASERSGEKDGSVAITIELPVGSKLALNLAWTDVRAEGPLGDCEPDMASGQVHRENIAALRANLAAGAVVIGHIAATADIEGGTASVRIGDIAEYQGTTGKVRIGHALSDIELDGSSGSFDIDRAEGNVIATAANCPIRIGRLTRGQAELTNASGGIEIGVSHGTVARVTPTAPRAPAANPCRHTKTPATPTTRSRSTPAPGSTTSSSTARLSESHRPETVHMSTSQRHGPLAQSHWRHRSWSAVFPPHPRRRLRRSTPPAASRGRLLQPGRHP
jgi:hypothetical protein